ncbi:4Fe-4S binding protein [Sediminitomix flava]|uniref:4Fe-4S binding protein n=1 Tax=Sediminitomix flava TaxID=379075 RepID=A0A315ZA28_SEDFL|nr:4Fe-4S dicluster domain-containing protein [Sediminitomix flava]PWJ42132.1 4Fe-4S binding protein [Sediminitomix flava]
MKSKRNLSILGLLIFIAAFGLFLSVPFVETYNLDVETVNKSIQDEEKRALFLKDNSMIGQEYLSSISFVNDLNSEFNKTNELVVAKYGISVTEISSIIKILQGENTYQLEVAQSQLSGDEEVLNFKKEMLQSYTSWMDNKVYNSTDELESQLTAKVSDINKGIATYKGIDQYQIKSVRFNLVKSANTSPVRQNPLLFLLLTYLGAVVGALLFILPQQKNVEAFTNDRNFQSALTNKGWLGILLGSFLILFYILLYFYPEYMTSWVIMVDPVSKLLSGNEAGEFFLYGFLYTICIWVMGIRMMIKYKRNNYQILRTISVMFFQTAFAFLIPEILIRLNYPYYDFKNIWPLDYDFFFDNSLSQLIASGQLGIFMLVWGIALVAVAVPVFTYFFGKRWYCSWVCGCGGLAETLGDPFRQLSDKSLKAWKIERIVIHSVLVFAVVMTAGVLYTYFTSSSSFLGMNTYQVRSVYGFGIGSVFSGVVGTGFYPLMGNRVWCRFGCPLAAYLGLVQRFKSRFRITTNGGQCISCGNCSTYCEMGIDVRWYAQRGQNIVRSSCVGCGVCASVCPRGVLKLENGKEENRFGNPILLGNNKVELKEIKA